MAARLGARRPCRPANPTSAGMAQVNPLTASVSGLVGPGRAMPRCCQHNSARSLRSLDARRGHAGLVSEMVAPVDRVVVVGAGIAGLAAASRLRRGGIPCVCSRRATPATPCPCCRPTTKPSGAASTTPRSRHRCCRRSTRSTMLSTRSRHMSQSADSPAPLRGRYTRNRDVRIVAALE